MAIANLLKIIRVYEIAKPGNTASHQDEGLFLASERILPQLTSSAFIPMPKNESVDSASIALAIPKMI